MGLEKFDQFFISLAFHHLGYLLNAVFFLGLEFIVH